MGLFGYGFLQAADLHLTGTSDVSSGRSRASGRGSAIRVA